MQVDVALGVRDRRRRGQWRDGRATLVAALAAVVWVLVTTVAVG